MATTLHNLVVHGFDYRRLMCDNNCDMIYLYSLKHFNRAQHSAYIVAIVQLLRYSADHSMLYILAEPKLSERK